MTERAEDAQAATLRAFTFLSSLRADWRGALIVTCGLGPAGSALSIAANIAGAGCLAIDERPAACRAALHSGACDFVVNTVDEALRVLKNEIRQRKPVSVGLTLAAAAALDELLDRGVLPELFTAFRADAELPVPDRACIDYAARRFATLGSLIADFDGSLGAAAGAIDATAQVEAFTGERGLRLESFAAASGEQLRAIDGRLQAVVPPEEPRHRWSAAAPRFFHRERPHRRVVFLTPEEAGALGAIQASTSLGDSHEPRP